MYRPSKTVMLRVVRRRSKLLKQPSLTVSSWRWRSSNANSWLPSTSAFTTMSTSKFDISTPRIKHDRLVAMYERHKQACMSLTTTGTINPRGVFCNNEINMGDIQVYGFDYDYTLAYYNTSLYGLIFSLARDILIEKHKYPSQLRHLTYLPHFPIRGIHFDKRRGWFMKVDSYHNIQLGSVFYGLNRIHDEDVIRAYGGLRLNSDDIGNVHHQQQQQHNTTSPHLHHFVDLFCLPEISLLASTFQYFLDKGIHFTPEYIFQDVHDAVNSMHESQLLHKKIVQSIDDYLLPISESGKSGKTGNDTDTNSSSIYVKEFICRLKASGKNTFLITNSPYWFVNFGMNSLLGSDWTHHFDLIICNARKPHFFTSKSKQFRQFNVKTNSKAWESVRQFRSNEVYYEGNLFEMLELTGWQGNNVLYFGDHIYGDLAQPFLKHRWRTGAIINELEDEVRTFNRVEFQRNAAWLAALERLIEKSMFLDEANGGRNHAIELRQRWLREREALKQASKSSFNPYFGSVFRTYTNPSYFSRHLARFADIYTSNVTNLLNYPVDCHFMPKRVDLAHEESIRVQLDNSF